MEGLSVKIMESIYRRSDKKSAVQFKPRDLLAASGIEWTDGYPTILNLQQDGLLKPFGNKLEGTMLTDQGLDWCRRRFEAGGVPAMYTEPIPRTPGHRRAELETLYKRLAGSDAGSRDWSLAKERIDQLRYAESRSDASRSGRRANTALVVSLLSAAVAVVGFLATHWSGIMAALRSVFP